MIIFFDYILIINLRSFFLIKILNKRIEIIIEVYFLVNVGSWSYFYVLCFSFNKYRV